MIGNNEFDCAYVSPTVVTITSSTRTDFIPTKISTTVLSNLTTEIEKLTTKFMLETTDVPNLTVSFSTEAENVVPTLFTTEKSTLSPSTTTEVSTEFTYEERTEQRMFPTVSTTIVVNETSSEGIYKTTPTAETIFEITSTTISEVTFRTTTPEDESSQATNGTITTAFYEVTSDATEIPTTKELLYSTPQMEITSAETAIFESSKYPQPTEESTRSSVSIEFTATPNMTIVPPATATSSEEVTSFLYTEETIFASSITPFLTMEPRSEAFSTSFSTVGSTVSSEYNLTTPPILIPDCTRMGNECRNGGTCTFDSNGYRVCLKLILYRII